MPGLGTKTRPVSPIIHSAVPTGHGGWGRREAEEHGVRLHPLPPLWAEPCGRAGFQWGPPLGGLSLQVFPAA